MQIIKINFFALHPGITVGKIDFTRTNGFDLSTLQSNPAFPVLGEMKIVIGFFIGGDGFHRITALF